MCVEKIIPTCNHIYVNIAGNNIYTYTGSTYEEVGEKINNASATAPGIMKLYSESGQNTDGTMTQKAITDELSEKIEVQIDEEAEMIIFGNW